MSGRRQHHIPRLHLRGFLIDAPGKTEKVCVYRKGRDPFVSPIEFVATERDFNSSPSTDESETLDDRITYYESSQLAGLMQTLRAAAIDETIDPEIAAEVIAHLAPRASHLRSVFSKGMTGIIETAHEAFMDEDNLARLIGLNDLAPSEAFRTLVMEPLYKEPAMASMPIPKPLMLQLVFWLARENFNSLFAQQDPMLGDMLSNLLEKAKDVARDGHIKAMTHELVPTVRLQDLLGYSWVISAAPPEGAILPDCVAITYDAKCSAAPYTLAPKSETKIVVMPVAKDKILLGSKLDAPSIDFGALNLNLAQCADTFFVSASQGPEIDSVFSRLGERAMTILTDALTDAKGQYLPKHDETLRLRDEASNGSTITDEVQRATLGFSYSVRLFDIGNDDTTREVAGVLNEIVTAAAQDLPLSRLDGFTFAEDVLSALRDLDRGPGVPKLENASEETQTGYAQIPLVIRDGVIKNHIVCSASFASNLLRENNSGASRWTVNLLVRLIASAAITEMVDKTFPGQLLKPMSDPYESVICNGLQSAHECYFTTYCAAGFGDKDAVEAFQRDHLIDALERAKVTMTDARTAYRNNGELDRIIMVAFRCVSECLRAAANLHGHCDSLDRSPFDRYGKLEEALHREGLSNWFTLLQRDLEAFWLRAWQWKSPQEFLDFNRHVERLLMQFGLMVWRDEKGDARFLVSPKQFSMVTK